MKASDYIYTVSGFVIDPSHPSYYDIELYDIAYGLAGIMRYNAQTRISVLRHSIALANSCSTDSERLWALLHDAPEAYMLDIPVPHKKRINDKWVKDYSNFEKVILNVFNCAPTDNERKAVLDMDKALVEYEMNSRERFELGSRMKYPLPTHLNIADIRKLDKSYMWEFTDSQLIGLYIGWVRELEAHEIA